jgi:hypothetical protein
MTPFARRMLLTVAFLASFKTGSVRAVRWHIHAKMLNVTIPA